MPSDLVFAKLLIVIHMIFKNLKAKRASRIGGFTVGGAFEIFGIYIQHKNLASLC